MTAAGVERQSKVRQDNVVIDVTTLQANYDRLWLHVRIIYVLLAILTACYFLFAAYTVFSTYDRHAVKSRPTAALDSGVAWQNLSSGVDDSGKPAAMEDVSVKAAGRRRRRSTSWPPRRLTRRLRAARDASWISHDDSKHDGGLWMTMHSKIPVQLSSVITYII